MYYLIRTKPMINYYYIIYLNYIQHFFLKDNKKR